MSLTFSEQYRMATVQDDFKQRVTAAVYGVAVTMFNATPNADATIQKQRMALAKQVVMDAESATQVFAWLCVSRPSVNKLEDLTDGFLTTTVTNMFDPVAQNVIPAASLP